MLQLQVVIGFVLSLYLTVFLYRKSLFESGPGKKAQLAIDIERQVENLYLLKKMIRILAFNSELHNVTADTTV